LDSSALAAWGSVTVTGPLGGGNRNSVLELRRGRERLVARRSGRPPASLDWEIGLLDHLGRHGLRVPAVVPARDGRRHVNGVVVLSWLDGHPPRPGDWPAVAAALRKLHAVTAGWPQRPGFVTTQELLTAQHSGDADLSVMPADAVADCRAAWRRLSGTPMAVVHGDPGPANIRMTAAGAGLLDWDEARVDYTDLDLADLPAGDPPAAYLPPARLAAARAAVRAWETASGWRVEPSYARRQLVELRKQRASRH
jgi:Ser/Thr protein kinase RdoA (MazF antagonist)